MKTMLRSAFALIALSLSLIALAADNTLKVTEDYLVGNWEGSTSGDRKVMARFEKEGLVIFQYINNGKNTTWLMQYSTEADGSKLSYKGKKPNGNTWEGQLAVTAEDQLSGDYNFFDNQSNRNFPSSLILKRAGK
jgi:hypothetical protein